MLACTKKEAGEEMSVPILTHASIITTTVAAQLKNINTLSWPKLGALFITLLNLLIALTPSLKQTFGWAAGTRAVLSYEVIHMILNPQFLHGQVQTFQACMGAFSLSDRVTSQNKHHPEAGQTGTQSQRSCNSNLEIIGFTWEV